MNIRSITGFLSLADPPAASALQPFGDLVQQARDDFARAGLPIQTARLATQPIPEIAPRDLTQFARELQAAAQAHGLDYVSLGAPRADHRLAPLEVIDAIPAALAATENVFGSVQFASHENGINLRAVMATARALRALSDLKPDGFGAFRFAALANCPPHSPFFPVAYHQGDEPCFAVATEGAPLAVQAFGEAQNLDQARANLIHAVERTAQQIAILGNQLAARFGIRLAGIDFSLAPFPEESQSIGAACERLTGAQFGERGTLFAAGFITDCLNRAHFPRTGFSGLMLPVLEDATLAARSGSYTLDSLLLYSTVCGTGLDTIPLPGDSSAEQIAAILLDLGTLAVKLNKPLTARLIPLAGLRAGDLTQFDYEYVTNARVLNPNACALRVFETETQVQFVMRKT
ncbi:MAG: DUF711 family protein [Chloroflexi bacterium]|nr:DUF711 family protein [Chloroflexota bacterium]